MNNDLTYVSPAVLEHDARMRQAEQRIFDAVALIVSCRAQHTAAASTTRTTVSPRSSSQILVWE